MGFPLVNNNNNNELVQEIGRLATLIRYIGWPKK